MSDAIRVGLIGYGYASKTFHAPLISGTPGMTLAAVLSSDEKKVWFRGFADRISVAIAKAEGREV